MVSLSIRRASLSGSYTASIYSCSSSPNTHLFSTSREQLLPKPYLRPRSLNPNNKHLQAARGQKQKRRMVGPVTSDGEKLEQKKSYGIGGAGNIRRPSEVIYPPRTNADGTRRRSSVWSTITASPGTSPEGKRSALLSLFSRKGSSSDGHDKENVEPNGQFREIHLGRKKERN